MGIEDIFVFLHVIEHYIIQTNLVQGRLFSSNKILSGNFPALSQLLSFSLLFSHFLGSQTPFEDDNSEDEWLETLSY